MNTNRERFMASKAPSIPKSLEFPNLRLDPDRPLSRNGFNRSPPVQSQEMARMTTSSRVTSTSAPSREISLYQAQQTGQKQPMGAPHKVPERKRATSGTPLSNSTTPDQPYQVDNYTLQESEEREKVLKTPNGMMSVLGQRLNPLDNIPDAPRKAMHHRVQEGTPTNSQRTAPSRSTLKRQAEPRDQEEEDEHP